MNSTGLLLTLSLLLHTLGAPALFKHVQADVSAETAVQNIPAQVAYGHLYRQIAYLDAKAREIEGQSKAEDSLRTFLKRQVGLSDEQNRVVSSVAADCEHAAVLIDEKALKVINALRLHNSVAGQSPRERARQEFQLRKLQVERNEVILSGRNRLAKALGARGFTQFDNFVMRSVGANIARQTIYTDRGSAYGYTQLWYDRDAFMAIGYSATELDYTAQIYYDAYVEGYLYLHNGMVWAKGSDSSLAGHAVTFTAAYVSPSSQYSFYSDHYVRAHQRKVGAADCQNCTRYYDPYCFSCLGPGGPHRFALAQAGNRAAQIDYNYIYLFSTRDTLATPNGLLPRAGESSFGMTLFAAVDHGKPRSNADTFLARGQAESATAGPANTERSRPAPIAAVDPNILELSVCPTSDVAPGNKTSLAPLAEDVAQHGHYDLEKNLRFRLWLTNYGTTPVLAWSGDPYYELRPQLMKGAETLAYKREVLSLTRAKENEPSDFGHAIVFRPGVPSQLNAIDLKDWYDPLGVGHYRLTILYRSHGSLSSNTVQFDISGDGTVLKDGPMRASPRQPAVPRP